MREQDDIQAVRYGEAHSDTDVNSQESLPHHKQHAKKYTYHIKNGAAKLAYGVVQIEKQMIVIKT